MITVDKLREQICEIDAEIIALIAKRQQLSKEIGAFKKINKIPVKDHDREEYLHIFHAKICAKYNISDEVVIKIFDILIAQSRKVQEHDT